MVTLVLTYRNRVLPTLENCLNSLAVQTDKNFKVVLIDYGSISEYHDGLKKLLTKYSFVSLISCKTTQQLWCKSRAINIALKQCETSHFFVGDIDMLYHPHFINILNDLKSETNATYFQVGFLSKEESKEHKSFENYTINFMSTKNATGMTLYPTAQLKAIRGYDEFYNGWGSEDTDVHVRLQNAQLEVRYYTNAILMLHQWHPKQYRKANDLAPFHSKLEQINASYLDFIKQSKQVKANTNFEWGIYNEQDYEALNRIDKSYSISNKQAEVLGFINAILLNGKNTVVQLDIYEHKSYGSAKQKLKTILGKKIIAFLDFETINNQLLECLICELRNNAYKYQYNRTKQVISLIIKL